MIRKLLLIAAIACLCHRSGIDVRQYFGGHEPTETPVESTETERTRDIEREAGLKFDYPPERESPSDTANGAPSTEELLKRIEAMRSGKGDDK